MMVASLMLLPFLLTFPQFLQPVEFTDPLQVAWVRSNDDLQGPVYFPWYPGIRVEPSEFTFPWIPDLSLMHGTFWLADPLFPRFSFLEPDTTRPMTYLFSRRGTWGYSHVGAFFGRDVARLRIHGGADFKTFQKAVSSVTGHNAWLYTRLHGWGTPWLAVFRADQTFMEKTSFRVLQMGWAPKWIQIQWMQWGGPQKVWTFSMRRILGAGSLSIVGSSRRKASPFVAGQWSFHVQKVLGRLGLASMNHRGFPLVEVLFQTQSSWLEAFSEAWPIWMPEDSLHPVTFSRAAGVRGGLQKKIRLFVQIQGAWDQWVHSNDAYTYQPFLWEGYFAGQVGDTLGRVLWNFQGSTYAWRDSIGVHTSTVVWGDVRGLMRWRDGRIIAAYGAQGAWITDPDHRFRLDLVGDMELFASVRLSLRIYRIWTTPIWNSQDLRYTLLITVRLPD